MKNYYEQYKNLHDSIIPIRGRAVEARPIGEGRRDWELIEMGKDVLCEYKYICFFKKYEYLDLFFKNFYFTIFKF